MQVERSRVQKYFAGILASVLAIITGNASARLIKAASASATPSRAGKLHINGMFQASADCQCPPGGDGDGDGDGGDGGGGDGDYYG